MQFFSRCPADAADNDRKIDKITTMWYIFDVSFRACGASAADVVKILANHISIIVVQRKE
jgi:hypothetical protein